MSSSVGNGDRESPHEEVTGVSLIEMMRRVDERSMEQFHTIGQIAASMARLETQVNQRFSAVDLRIQALSDEVKKLRRTDQGMRHKLASISDEIEDTKTRDLKEIKKERDDLIKWRTWLVRLVIGAIVAGIVAAVMARMLPR